MVQMVNIGIGVFEVPVFYNLFCSDVQDVEHSGYLWTNQHKSAAQILNLSGKIHLTVGQFFNLPIQAAYFLNQTVASDAQEAVLWQQLHQIVLILDGNVLHQSLLRAKFPAYSVLIGNYQQEISSFLDLLLVKFTIHDELILRHLVPDKEVGMVQIWSYFPDLKSVSMIDNCIFRFARDPIDPAVADSVEERALKLSFLQRIETEVRCDSSTDEIVIK